MVALQITDEWLCFEYCLTEPVSDQYAQSIISGSPFNWLSSKLFFYE